MLSWAYINPNRIPSRLELKTFDHSVDRLRLTRDLHHFVQPFPRWRTSNLLLVTSSFDFYVIPINFDRKVYRPVVFRFFSTWLSRGYDTLQRYEIQQLLMDV